MAPRRQTLSLRHMGLQLIALRLIDLAVNSIIYGCGRRLIYQASLSELLFRKGKAMREYAAILATNGDRAKTLKRIALFLARVRVPGKSSTAV